MKLFSSAWILATAAVVKAQTFPPSGQPSSLPTQPPSPVVSDAPSSTVNNTESASPSDLPTTVPTLSPQPTGALTSLPTLSIAPTEATTSAPTLSFAPTGESTIGPTLSSQPTATASSSPSSLPTVSSQPSSIPSLAPTSLPSVSHQPTVTASDAPTSLPTRTIQPSDEPTSVPTLSSQPVAAFSSSPTHIPTDPPADTGPPYSACPICASGDMIGNPLFVLPGTDGQTCASANDAGLAGNIPPDACAALRQTGPTLCACAAMTSADTVAPTASPVASTVIAPSSGDCNTTSCTLVPVWDQLQAFVDAADDGDSLCLCGRFYEEATCGTASITMDETKEVTLECSPGQICSFECPQIAFVVNAGILTLQGNEQNFVMTGGSTLSRIVVGAEGTLVADQTAFENTKATVPPSTSDSRRRLQQKGSRGGAIQTYGVTTVSDTKFENCTATLEGGAVYVGSGTASFLTSTFEGNRAFEGAAIFVEAGGLTVQDSVFSNNVATATDGNPDIFARSGVRLDVCGNTGESDVLGDECSAAFDTRSIVWTMASAAISLLVASCI